MAYTLEAIADELDCAGFCDFAERIRALEEVQRLDTRRVDVVFDGPPGPDSGTFVEVEDMAGCSIRVGEWIERDDGYWALRMTVVQPLSEKGTSHG